MSKQTEAIIQVNNDLYELAKADTINCVLVTPGTHEDEQFSREDQPTTLVIKNRDNTSQMIKRDVVFIDHVQFGYRSRGYPAKYKAKGDMTRVVFHATASKKETHEPAQKA